jgi:hypothetical protein
MLGSAKMQSGAAGRGAQLQTQAANRAAQLQSESAAAQLAYLKGESELDRASKRHADRQNYGLSKAEMMNQFSRFGDSAYNVRSSELSRGRTDDNLYGERQKQFNTMRQMMGMPNKSLSVYAEPRALRLTAPTLPAYVEEPLDEQDNA